MKVKEFFQVSQGSRQLFLSGIDKAPMCGRDFWAQHRMADEWEAEVSKVNLTARTAEQGGLWFDGVISEIVLAEDRPMTATEQQTDGQKNAAPGSKSGTAQRHISTASATAAWKVLQAMGYVNETPFQETQDFLRKAQEILETMKQAGIDPVYWESVLAMAATFDAHMRG